MAKNIFERRAEESKRYKRVDGSIFPEDQEDIRARSTRKAPYVAISWIERFFDLNHRLVIDHVDAEFIRLNIVGSGNESKTISALQFLGLIDGSGKATSKLASLRVVGDDFKKNLQKIVREAYSDLVSTIVLEAARKESLINFFVQRYDYSYTSASAAARLFIWLSLQAGISISEELQSLGTESSLQTKSKPPSTERIISRPGRRMASEVAPTVQETTIQATINIQLDKDTPREFWDRVLALLGEKRRQEDLGEKQT